MKTPIKVTLILLALTTGALHLHAQGTAFTYQGRLNDGANPANGSYDLRFTLHGDAVLPGFEVGLPRTNSAVAVSNGLFTIVVDFGPAFDHQPRWIELGVRPADSTNDFTTLAPRQPVTVAPKADFANRAQTLTAPLNEGLLPSSALRRYVNETVTGLFHFSPLPGNPPFTVGSSELVPNLNADKLDGNDADAVAAAVHSHTLVDQPIVILADQKTSGSHGGDTPFSPAWTKRDLNTEIADAAGLASLSSSQITLAAGTYEVHGSCPACGAGNHVARLHNVTDDVTLVLGTSEEAATGVQNRSILQGRFTIATSKTLEVQHIAEEGGMSNGWGVGNSYTTPIFTIIQFTKLA